MELSPNERVSSKQKSESGPYQRKTENKTLKGISKNKERIRRS